MTATPQAAPAVDDSRPTPPASAAPAAPSPRHKQDGPLRTVARLTLMELRLMGREPMVLVSLLGLPVVAMVVIAGVFGQTPEPEFGNVAPDEYYIASYLGVVLASLGLVTLPVHIATSRDLGVTRRFRASGLSTGSLVTSQLVMGVVLGVTSTAIVLLVGNVAYGIDMPLNTWGVVGWYIAGLACFIVIGGALGLLAPSGRAANAVGNLLFFPALLLGGGGPPRDVMNGAMQTVSSLVPLSHITGGMRHAWLDASDSHIVAWWPPTVALLALAAALYLVRRRAA